MTEPVRYTAELARRRVGWSVSVHDGMTETYPPAWRPTRRLALRWARRWVAATARREPMEVVPL